MSSLKYIFVIEDNVLVRKLQDEAAKQAEATTIFQESEDAGRNKELSSETTEHKSRNKRNKTSRGK